MERRSALKNMGMAFGYAVATPTLLSLLQSCKDKPSYAEWVPSFLSKEQGQALALTLDVILPKTDTPSATEVNVHTFIDSYMDEVMPLEQREFTMMKMEKFYDKILESSGKENLADLEVEDIDPVLTTYLRKRTDEEEDAHREAVMNYFQTIQQGGEATLDSEVACYTFANELRDLAIWAYKSSEMVGEEVLAYLPIPGEFVPCGDLQELTGGKAWSE
ncbi:gluconate 2-dehydrogenase subunit 3 family protein [Flagellimonas taeanensis]|uniref:gluconate 2-dehydrogenase subunit 3 family protein n=1 Tax=Flavobacteriaceae TaxID=49546 RepID=UPI000E68E9CD|nr:MULTISPECIES: gluconate 2-dehydrogenase subunit 3 family protein [Allomuricauda]MDC6385367.1 gluconate 2-dehydrogenase subunit 3 family protein [Muricauda sp. SK9]MEE1961543.1 gluconate 2-dehydrogenase subunit 3 family protein [Allomuricauda taeanensis]RIV53115.1 gluconate 2-dehydrogenase subunit 3 family protein [Allomuricauda taeanensis]